MDHFYSGRSLIGCLIVCSVVIFRTTDAGSVTWFEPSPFETVKDPLIISTANESLVKGSLNGELSCNFSLSADLSIITVSIHFGGTSVANFAQSQQAQSVSPGFEGRFNVTWVPNKLTLIFFNVTSEDEGEFRCDVLTLLSPGSVIQTWKRKIQVSLLVPPEIFEVTGETVIERENVTLKCIAEGKPTPTITWTRLSDDSIVTMPLINISRNSEKDFKCTANNGIGTPATRKVSVDVLYAVEPTGSGENVSWVDGGRNFSFSCPVDGNPQPNITWYKAGDVDGSKISSGKQLTNMPVSVDSEEHLCYTCVASNSLGTPVHVTQCLLIEHPTVPTNSKSTPIKVSEGSPWTVIGTVAGIGVFMVIAVGLVVYWVRKKRKSGKETKEGELQHLEADHIDNEERLESTRKGNE